VTLCLHSDISIALSHAQDTLTRGGCRWALEHAATKRRRHLTLETLFSDPGMARLAAPLAKYIDVTHRFDTENQNS